MVLAPGLAVLTGIVAYKHGWPPVFVQSRPGIGGREFRIIKLRTMTSEKDGEGNLLPDSRRLTPLGQFLRSASLDEFPELWNVLVGEMSLVGPRPLLMSYLERYSAEQARRHEMPPGITGLAQVRGRNALSWPEKFSLDIQYVDEWSLALDLRILLETVGTVLQRSGVAAKGEATMPEFLGQS